MKNYGIIDAIKNLGYIRFLLNEWYFDHIQWRIHHLILGERCENCRNYHYNGKYHNVMYGTCDVYTHNWTTYHGHCACWNIDFQADEDYTTDEDGCERPHITLTGKEITQISRSGIWQYLYDGEPKWYRK